MGTCVPEIVKSFPAVKSTRTMGVITEAVATSRILWRFRRCRTAFRFDVEHRSDNRHLLSGIKSERRSPCPRNGVRHRVGMMFAMARNPHGVLTDKKINR
jgi:hypothetical protein